MGYYNQHFIDEKYEELRSEVIWPESHSKIMEEAVWLQSHYCHIVAYSYMDMDTWIYGINLYTGYRPPIDY